MLNVSELETEGEGCGKESDIPRKELVAPTVLPLCLPTPASPERGNHQSFHGPPGIHLRKERDPLHLPEGCREEVCPVGNDDRKVDLSRVWLVEGTEVRGCVLVAEEEAVVDDNLREGLPTSEVPDRGAGRARARAAASEREKEAASLAMLDASATCSGPNRESVFIGEVRSVRFAAA